MEVKKKCLVGRLKQRSGSWERQIGGGELRLAAEKYHLCRVNQDKLVGLGEMVQGDVGAHHLVSTQQVNSGKCCGGCKTTGG